MICYLIEKYYLEWKLLVIIVFCYILTLEAIILDKYLK